MILSNIKKIYHFFKLTNTIKTIFRIFRMG